MEVAVAKDLLEEDRGRLVEHGSDIMAGVDQGIPVIHRNSRQALLRHDTAGRAPPIDRRHAIGRIAGEIAPQLRGRCRLEPQIHLHSHHFGECFDDFAELEPAQPGLRALDQAGQPAHQVEVPSKRTLDAGAQHLDCDLAALEPLAWQAPRIVHLGDRCRGDRIVVEGDEQFFDGRSEFGFNGATCFGGRKRFQAVLQKREVGGDILAKQVGAGGKHLAELDEYRAQLGQRSRQTLPRPSLLAASRSRAREDSGGAQNCRRQT